MPGSQTTPGPTGARNNASADFAFRQVNNVGTRVDNDFAAQWLAYTLPYRRFADVLADACARIGGDVDCYSFIAVDFHHILLASLPAHLLALRPAHSRSHQIRDRYPGASGSLPAGAVAGRGLHPLETRRLVTARTFGAAYQIENPAAPGLSQNVGAYVSRRGHREILQERNAPPQILSHFI